jgi:hypothetical protein
MIGIGGLILLGWIGYLIYGYVRASRKNHALWLFGLVFVLLLSGPFLGWHGPAIAGAIVLTMGVYERIRARRKRRALALFARTNNRLTQRVLPTASVGRESLTWRRGVHRPI